MAESSKTSESSPEERYSIKTYVAESANSIILSPEADEVDDTRSSSPLSPEVSSRFIMPQPIRKAAKNSPGHKNVLGEWVSDWKLRQVEKYLQIYFSDEYLETPKDVIQKIPTAKDLTEQQRKYVHDLQNFLEFDSNYDEFWLKTSLVEKKIANLKSKLKPTDDLLSQPVYISKGEIFINVFDSFFDEFIEMKKTRFQLFEGMFTSLIVSLGQACCLTPSLCSRKHSQTRWIGLRGINVVSEPDGRFFNSPTFGPSSTLKPKALVSVVEVKNSKKFGYSGLKHSEKPGRKRYKSSTEYSSTDESVMSVDSTSTSSISTSSSSKLLSDMEMIPEIFSYISSSTLAQHAGELLIDLHKYRSSEKVEKYTLPGMIVDGTKVYFTLLEMSDSHHKKLADNHALDESDRAVVYYAKPLDILGQDDRNLIIESLVRLHNI